MFSTLCRALAVAALVVLPTMAPAVTAQDQSLFDRLGGQAGVEAAVDQFLANVGGDARINSFFANADLGRLRTLLVEQICAAAGGPCVYTGRSMRETHAGMGVTDAHFTAIVEDLGNALDTVGATADAKAELLGLLAPMQADIVQPPAAPAAPPSAPAAPSPSPAAPPPAAAAPAAVTIQGFAFNPPTIQVAVGGTVTWTNRDGVTHTATGSNFNAGTVPPGQSASASFATAGRFPYQCSIHNSMRGEVVVQ